MKTCERLSVHPRQLAFAIVEVAPAGPNHPLSEDALGAYCQVIAEASDASSFRGAVEAYFLAQQLSVLGFDDFELIETMEEVAADEVLLGNIEAGYLSRDGIAFGTFNSFWAEGEA